jgi:hypothetical protein
VNNSRSGKTAHQLGGFENSFWQGGWALLFKHNRFLFKFQ